MAKIRLHANRASALLQRAADAVDADDMVPGRGTVHVTYICDAPLEITLEPNDRLFRLIRKEVYNEFADKGRLGDLVTEYGMQAHFPITCKTVAEAQAHPEVGLWFVKNRHGTSGRNMRCASRDDLAKLDLGPYDILQEGMDDIRLIDGRKFVSRIYVLVWDGRVFLYRDGFHVVHGVPYVPGSTDYKVQIEHEGYHKADGGPYLMPFAGDPEMAERFAAVETTIRGIAPSLARLRAASSRGDYIMLGLDLITLSDGSMRVIEINAIPNFVHPEPVASEVNVPFFTMVIETLLGRSPEDLVEIATD